MNVALHGGYITENFGDELLVIMHSKWVSKTSEHLYLPYASKEYFDQLDAESVYGEEALSKSNILMYIGGGYLGESNHQKWRWGFRFIRRKHHIPAVKFLEKKKPYAIIGAGAGPITNLWTRKKIVSMCKNAEIVAVRDEESKNYLTKYGVKSEKIRVTADTVLNLRQDDIPEYAVEFAKNQLKQIDREVFGVHLGISLDDQNYKKQAELIIDGIVEFFNNNSNFIPLIIEDKRYSSDQSKTKEEIVSRLKVDYLHYRHEDVWKTCAILGELDKVITTKLHVGITAYALETIPFSFAAHQKTRRFYDQIGMSENCVDLSNIITVDQTLQMLNNYSKQDKVLNDTQVKKLEAMREKAQENMSLTQKFLDSNL